MNLVPATPGRSRWCLVASLCLACLIPMACGPSGPKLVKVRGRVTYQGKPVTKGTVAFQSTQPDRRNATGQIDPDGYYTLQTEAPGDGAEAGAYYVAIFSRDDVVLDYIPATPIPPKYLVPQKFENPEKSGIIKTVSYNGGAIDIDLKD